MAYVITEPCIGVKDKECMEACPVDAIHGGEADQQLFINPDDCICCGGCYHVCPVEAIFEETDVPAKWHYFIDLNAAHYKQ